MIFILQLSVTGQYKNGYIVDLNNDTIPTRVKYHSPPFGIGTYDVFKKVIIKDSLDAVKTFTPSEIKGFGYTRKSVNYTMVSKQAEKGNTYFMEPLSTGPNICLYWHYTIQSRLVYGSYTFERADGSTFFIEDNAGIKN